PDPPRPRALRRRLLARRAPLARGHRRRPRLDRRRCVRDGQPGPAEGALMARFRRSSGGAVAAEALPREHQTTLFERLDALARRATPADPSAPAVKLLCIVLALMALGLLLQATHAATISAPEAFVGEIRQQAK